MYSSPLLRATETALIIATGLGSPVKITDALREPSCGEIEGRSDAEAWRLHAALEKGWAARNYDHRIRGGESFNDVRIRFIPFVEHIAATLSTESGRLVMVSHGSLLMPMLPLVLLNVEARFVRVNGLRY